MALSCNGQELGVCGEEVRNDVASNGYKINIVAPLSLSVSTSRKGLLTDDNSPAESSERRLSYINKLKLIKFGGTGNLASPSARFRQIAEKRDVVSRFVPSAPQGPKEGFSYEMMRSLNFRSMLNIGKEWIKNPLNMALLVWVTCVAVSGAILFLVMTGMLNHVIRGKSERDEWFEVNNQILNALFTLMCLYQHPKRFHHLVLLFRWKPEDITRLREIYCKNGSYKPHEWAHMMVVILLLHLNCFAQYALCGLNLGYKRSERPGIGVGICLVVAIAAPAVAGVYCIVSPLGKEYESEEMDCEASGKEHERRKTMEKREREEEMRKWKGSLFDMWEDTRVAYLSIFCTCCVFGWNMERVGFGNRYVHIATFVLVCTAPFWIFNLAASNIENERMREGLGIIGILLCLLGLMYGGYWRNQMRKRLNIGGDGGGGGGVSVRKEIEDCMDWLCCCCWCSLAQEVRTADYYYNYKDEDGVDEKKNNHLALPRPRLSPLPRESAQFRTHPTSPPAGPASEADGIMKSPSLVTITRGGEEHSEDKV